MQISNAVSFRFPFLILCFSCISYFSSAFLFQQRSHPPSDQRHNTLEPAIRGVKAMEGRAREDESTCGLHPFAKRSDQRGTDAT